MSTPSRPSRQGAGNHASVTGPDVARYHLDELRIARDSAAPGHLLPPIPADCRAVLDIGCGAGQSLIASRLGDHVIACGVDPDVAALALGRTLAANIEFAAATGEQLPYADASFDLVFSRVALPYTDIPRALAEIARVLRPGGTIWLSLHPPVFALRAIARALRGRHLKGALFAVYVLANGLLLHLLGQQMRWPFGRKRRYESVQTASGMRRALQRAGFDHVRVERGRFFVVTARRA